MTSWKKWKIENLIAQNLLNQVERAINRSAKGKKLLILNHFDGKINMIKMAVEPYFAEIR